MFTILLMFSYAVVLIQSITSNYNFNVIIMVIVVVDQLEHRVVGNFTNFGFTCIQTKYINQCCFSLMFRQVV